MIFNTKKDSHYWAIFFFHLSYLFSTLLPWLLYQLYPFLRS